MNQSKISLILHLFLNRNCFFVFDFEQFPVYQKSELYYSQVLKLIAHSKIDQNLRDQLKRASLSVVLNIAEGAGKYTKNDKKTSMLFLRVQLMSVLLFYEF